MSNRAEQRLRILFVFADDGEARGLASAAEAAGFETSIVATAKGALTARDVFSPDAVVIELHAPAVAEMELVRHIANDLPVLVITGHEDIPSAVAAMTAGAAHGLRKPVAGAELVAAIRAAVGRRARSSDVADRAGLRERRGLGLGRLVGSSDAMQRVFRAAKRVADARASVLIVGESGVGKGALARTIHEVGSRRSRPFVRLSCAKLTTALIGCDEGRPDLARFERARGGTVFLDQIGDIPPAAQAALLGVFQERLVAHAEGREPIALDIRVIAATHRDLAHDVEAGRFREDLYYRLNVVRIEMPPLRERGGDVLLLAQSLLERQAARVGATIVGFDDAARERLMSHSWPGNVRELDNVIAEGVARCTSTMVRDADLPELRSPPKVSIPGSTLRDIERHAILTTYEATGQSAKRTAKMLGMSLRTVQYRLRDYGLGRGRGRPPKSKEGWERQAADGN